VTTAIDTAIDDFVRHMVSIRRESTALRDGLEMARVLLKAMPDDVPLPRFASDTEGVELEWPADALVRDAAVPDDALALVPMVFVWIAPAADYSWALDEDAVDGDTIPFAFDGTVPPEIVAAIRRVAL
jgi:hypothetical protein